MDKLLGSKIMAKNIEPLLSEPPIIQPITPEIPLNQINRFELIRMAKDKGIPTQKTDKKEELISKISQVWPQSVDKLVTFESLLTTAQLDGVNIYKSGTFNAAANGNLFGETKYGKIAKTTLFQVYQIDRYIITNLWGE